MRGVVPEPEAHGRDGKVRVVPRLLGAGEVGPFAYALKAGVMYRAADQDFAGTPVGTELLVGAAAGFHLADKKLMIGPEIYGGTVIGEEDDKRYGEQGGRQLRYERHQ